MSLGFWINQAVPYHFLHLPQLFCWYIQWNLPHPEPAMSPISVLLLHRRITPSRLASQHSDSPNIAPTQPLLDIAFDL